MWDVLYVANRHTKHCLAWLPRRRDKWSNLVCGLGDRLGKIETRQTRPLQAQQTQEIESTIAC